VLLKLPAALLADVQRSISAVDISNPDLPVLSASLPSNLGGIASDQVEETKLGVRLYPD
jgi:hypothetical protein